MKNFSRSTEEILEVVKETKENIVLYYNLTGDITAKQIKSSVTNGIVTTAQKFGITESSVREKCCRNLEVNMEQFLGLIYDHFTCGDLLIDAVCSHCKNIVGDDNPTDIRIALENLRL